MYAFLICLIQVDAMPVLFIKGGPVFKIWA
jgi:hypothetical protein